MRVIKVVLVALLYTLAALIGAMYLFPEQALKFAVGGERARSGLSQHEIQVEGRRWVYLEGGQGQTLLLIHGFGADKDNFTRVAASLTPRYRVIVPDLLGFGESDKPADVSYTIENQLERLRGFAQALGLSGPVHLGGSSMGGNLAAAWAAKYPGEVASLWLLAPGGVSSAPISDLTALMRQGTANPLIAHNTEEFRTLFSFAMAEPPFVPPPFLDVMAQRRIANVALEERIFEAIRNESTPLEKLIPKGLATPTRIVWGDRDRALNVGGAEILHKLLPQSSVLILPYIGHLPMIERPREVADDYLAFRATLK